MTNRVSFRLLGALCLGLLAYGNAWALEFSSIAANSTILYDAPSLKAKRLFVASQYFPVEVIVNLGEWAKVRDYSGSLAWLEKKQLSAKRTVLVTVPLADIRQAPESGAPLVFQAEQNVALEWMENASPGWIKVRHRDGQVGLCADFASLGHITV